MTIQIAPSILSADFCNLERDLKAISTADLVHVDVMDEPVEPIFDILDEFDMILIMTVEPGFGGQRFLDNQMSKVRRLRDEITRRGLATKIQVDGGVSPKTAHIVAEAGADVLVAGSAVYGAENPAEAIDSIREKAEAAFKA